MNLSHDTAIHILHSSGFYTLAITLSVYVVAGYGNGFIVREIAVNMTLDFIVVPIQPLWGQISQMLLIQILLARPYSYSVVCWRDKITSDTYMSAFIPLGLIFGAL